MPSTRSRQSSETRAGTVPLDEDHESAATIPATQEDRLLWRDMLRGLERLPEEQRSAIALVLVEGLSYREAAEALGIAEGTLTSRLGRGRAALQALLAEGGYP